MRTYDAGDERQWLARALADWQDWEAIPLAQAEFFEHRLRRLARALGWTRGKLLQCVRGDVEQLRINEEDNE